MKVGELIEKLAACDLDAEIVIQDSGEMITLHAVETLGYVPTRVGRTLAINAEYCDDRTDDARRGAATAADAPGAWTAVPPAVPGWYWYDDVYKDESKIIITHLDNNDLWELPGEEGKVTTTLMTYDGRAQWWTIPLEPPSPPATRPRPGPSFGPFYSVAGNETCVELTEDELDTVKVAELDEDDAPTGRLVTAREQLQGTWNGVNEAAYVLRERE